MSENEEYPVLSAFPELLEALKIHRRAILTAPPGAGKSTVLPLRFLQSTAITGKILMLEPRRIAARAIAARIATLLGEAPGGQVGYRIRGESCVSSTTRLEIVTEGMLTRKLQSDPELPGVELVIFDEFHERSLAADLGLALTLDAADGLRPDLKILVMSATLAVPAIAVAMGNAPCITATGRAFPLDVSFGEPTRPEAMCRTVAAAVRRALAENAAGVLAFLPGAREIARTAAFLQGTLPEGVSLHPLHGGLDAREQDKAIAPPSPGERKVVLATNVAETSLTLRGIDYVVDSTWERRMLFDPCSGLSRLELGRIARSSAEQRAGRAGRTGPGRVFHACSHREYQALPPAREAEILSADLAPLALEIAEWGTPAGNLRWVDPPPPAMLFAGEALLCELGALRDASLTRLGRELARLGVHPRLGTMLLKAQERGFAPLAAELAAILEERDILFNAPSVDLRLRLARLRSNPGAYRASVQLRDQLLRLIGGVRYVEQNGNEAGLILAFGFPDRIGRSRSRHGGQYLLSGGRGAELPRADDLAAEEFLVVPRLDGGGATGRIQLAAPLTEKELLETFGEQLTENDDVRWDAESQRTTAFRETKLGALVLASRRIAPPPEEAQKILAAELRKRELHEWVNDESLRYLERLRFAARNAPETYPAAGAEYLLAALPIDAKSLADAQSIDWKTQLGHPLAAKLERDFPERFTAPTGNRLRIDYSGDAPSLSIRVQELFGLARHPAVGMGGRFPLKLELLSPAQRPVQITADLPGFWAGSWALVRKEMKSRYPRHEWPEDPASALPTTRAKPRKS